jgi:hypothetical protein
LEVQALQPGKELHVGESKGSGARVVSRVLAGSQQEKERDDNHVGYGKIYRQIGQ